MTEENGRFFVKGDPLRFIHFSGYGATIKRMNDWLPEGDHPFRKLYREYSKLHEKIMKMEFLKHHGAIANIILGE